MEKWISANCYSHLAEAGSSVSNHIWHLLCIKYKLSHFTFQTLCFFTWRFFTEDVPDKQSMIINYHIHSVHANLILGTEYTNTTKGLQSMIT